MVWHEGEEIINDCGYCEHYDLAGRSRCAEFKRCAKCKGTHQHIRKFEGWAPYGRTIRDILAEYHGIDQAKVEAEKRTMLEVLRKQAAPPVNNAHDNGHLLLDSGGAEELR